MKRAEQDFLHGLAYAVGWIIKYHGEDAIAMDLLRSSGYSYADLVKARCDQNDLAPIAQALGLQPKLSSGKKRSESRSICFSSSI